MICLSFDTDHMGEARMIEFFDTIDLPGAGTFFCTQKYSCLEPLHHESAPHPTLQEGSDWQAELKRMREMFPNALGWRSHSCVFSHLLAEWLATNGYRYASTNDQFGQQGIKPIRHPWGVWHFPIYYMDNMDFSSACFWSDGTEGPFSDGMIETALDNDGIYVFDFHPIHILLNTPNRDYYFNVRDRFKAGSSLEELTYKGEGTATFYNRLCEAMRKHNQNSLSLGEALETYLASQHAPEE